MIDANEISIDSNALYSTAEVAAICRVAPRTVAKWFDSGRLGGHTLPGTMFRRIPAKALRRFLRAHGMDDLWDGFLDRTGRTGGETNAIQPSEAGTAKVTGFQPAAGSAD